ncbi:hypothetical protein JW777_09245 [bacterium]|nr:hypothetical protein [bacterium]
MTESTHAVEPFRFYTRLHLTELLGIKASSLAELIRCMKSVPGSSIYHHTHRFLQQHQYLSPEPPNDFAYWATEALGEEALGEHLASVNTVQFGDIRSLRESLCGTMERYAGEHPRALNKTADPGEEFFFMKSVSFILPTRHEARTLEEFAGILQEITADSLYYHMFESRLRLEKQTNDFSTWFSGSLGDAALAADVERLDPYTHTMEGLRRSLLRLIRSRIPRR